MSDNLRVQFSTRQMLGLTTAVCVLLGIPGLVWLLFPFAAISIFFGIGAVTILIGSILVYLFVLVVPPLRERMLDSPHRFESEIAVHKARRATRESDA